MNDVDVIIPVHGTPIFLFDTLQSIGGQSNINKIIIVLDRVDKEYFSKLNVLQDNLIVVTSNTPGIVSALNTGLQISKADYIARIDSDDMMHPGRIDKQRDFLVSNPMCVCVGSNLEIFDEISVRKIKKYPNSHRKIIKQLTYQNAIAHPSVMFRRKAVLEAGCYRPLFEGSEDYDLWFRLSKIGDLNNINFPFTKYRISSGQYSSKFSTYRVELDSFVRLLNLADIKEFPTLNYDELVPGPEIQKYYRNFLSLVKEDNKKLYNDLKNAEKFSVLLNYKNFQIISKFDHIVLLLLALRLILMSPKFSLKVIFGKILT